MANSPSAETPLADLTDAPSGLVLDVYLLAPDILFDNMGVLDHVLADAHLFLDNRALLHHDLFLGDGDAHLDVADLGLRSLPLNRDTVDGDLFVAGGYLHALAAGPDVFWTLTSPASRSRVP